MPYCFRRSFDNVTQISFRFRRLVMWSSPHDRDASSHQIWCKDLYPFWSYCHFSEIQDGGRRHLGFLSYVNLGHSGVLIVWCLSSVSNLVKISVTVTLIDAHMLQTLMTSREWTFGFNCWSCDHLRMDVMHLPTKCGAYIFICCAEFNIYEIQDGRCPPHLICWGAAGPPTKAHSCCVPPAKISS